MKKQRLSKYEVGELEKGDYIPGSAPHAGIPGPPPVLPHPKTPGLTVVQPAGEGQRAVLYIEGEVVDVQATGGHHLEGLVVLDLTVMPDIHIRDVWRLPNVHTGRGRGVGLGLKKQVKPWMSEGL